MRIIFLTISLLSIFICHAQIGYQVALLDRANGEPRANETVSVTVKITNSEGATVCSETKTETSNDFGILSMTVGSSSTFTDTDWSKLPFFIEATVDNVLIGKSQLLSVPVAEYAKRTDELDKKLIKRTCSFTDAGDGESGTIRFTDSTVSLTIPNWGDGESLYLSGPYAISGYVIISPIGSFIYDKNSGRIYGRVDDVDINAQ